MKAILADRHRLYLREFLGQNPLLVLDYDGTLAPIHPIPWKAHMRPETSHLLRELCRRIPCVVLTGRDRPDIVPLLVEVPLAMICSNHGLDPWGDSPENRTRVAGWAERLEASLPRGRGIRLEVKSLSLAIHYRSASRRTWARRSILEVTGALEEARVVPGKDVINITPLGAGDKGSALKNLRDHLGVDRVVFVGDDVNDEDAFALEELWLLGIRVGRRRGSAARYCLRDQPEIDRFLGEVLGACSGGVGPRTGSAG